MPFLGGQSAAQPPIMLEGVPLWVYGSSFTVDPAFSATAGMEFFKLVRTRLGMSSVTTYGSNGKSIRDAAERIIGGKGIAGAQWLPTRKGVVILDTWVNDLAAYAAGAVPRAFEAKDVTGLRANLYSALAYMSASSIIENTVGVKAGTWQADGASNERSGGNNSITTEPGASMTFAGVNFPAEGYIFYLGHTLDPVQFPLANVEIYVDGTLNRTIPREEFAHHRLVEGTSDATGSGAWKIEAAPGAHEVRFVNAGVAGEALLVDALVIPRAEANRSPVFVVQDQMPRGVVAGAYYQPEEIPVLEGNWPQLQALYDEVLADFPNAVFVPTTLDAATDYGPDGLHPNDRGMQKKADELVAAMTKFFAKRRPNNLYTTL